MTLSSSEFIRRFLIHILPDRFMKIRHYGLLGNRNKTRKLMVCKQLTNTPVIPFVKASTLQLIQKLIGKDVSKCPHCGSDKLSRYMGLGNSPPITLQTPLFFEHTRLGREKLYPILLYLYDILQHIILIACPNSLNILALWGTPRIEIP